MPPTSEIDKDSDKRQNAAIAAFARRNGYEIVDTYYDAAVSALILLPTAKASPRCCCGSRPTVLGPSSWSPRSLCT